MRCKHCGVPVIWLGSNMLRERRGWFAQPERPGRTGFRCPVRPPGLSHEADLPDMADRSAVEEWLDG